MFHNIFRSAQGVHPSVQVLHTSMNGILRYSTHHGNSDSIPVRYVMAPLVDDDNAHRKTCLL